jgi:hypothetical protein
MNIKNYEVKRRCNAPRFLVVVTCQGQSFYYQYHNLIGAVIGYCKQYLTKRKYGTMNFKLRQVMITDEFGEESE